MNYQRYLNDQKEWSKMDDLQLISLFKKEHGITDKMIKKLNRKRSQIEERLRYISCKTKPKIIWELSEDILLLQMIDKLGKDWEMVQKVVKTKDIPSCKRRLARIRDSDLHIDDIEDRELLILDQFWLPEDLSMLQFLWELYKGDYDKISERMSERAKHHCIQKGQNNQLSTAYFVWTNEKKARLLSYKFYGIQMNILNFETSIKIDEIELVFIDTMRQIIDMINDDPQRQQFQRDRESKKSTKKVSKNFIQNQNIYNRSYAEEFNNMLNSTNKNRNKLGQKIEEEDRQEFEIGDIVINQNTDSDSD